MDGWMDGEGSYVELRYWTGMTESLRCIYIQRLLQNHGVLLIQFSEYL